MSGGKNLQILGYGTFSDIPRGVFVKVDKDIIHLECDFDEILDDYKDFYKVYMMIGPTRDDFYTGRFYYHKYSQVYIGDLSLRDITFDSTRRKSLKSEKLETMINHFNLGEKYLSILRYGILNEVPRSIFVKVENIIVFLDCEFDELAGAYKEYYNVYVVRRATAEDFYAGTFYHQKYERDLVGQLRVQDITFDTTKSRFLKSKVLEKIIENLEDSPAKMN